MWPSTGLSCAHRLVEGPPGGGRGRVQVRGRPRELRQRVRGVGGRVRRSCGGVHLRRRK